MFQNYPLALTNMYWATLFKMSEIYIWGQNGVNGGHNLRIPQ